MLVGIVVGVFAYWCAANEEQVRGAAIWRQDGRAVYGIFVAEGAARVYLAQFRRRADDKVVMKSSRLVGIAKSDVTDIAIAGRHPVTEALDEARALAKDLCALRLAPGARREQCVVELREPA